MALETYDVLRLIHVVSAFFLIGSIPLEYLLVRRNVVAGDRAALARLLRDLDWVETRIAIPMAGLLLGTGLGMTLGPLARWRLFDAAAWFPTVALGLFVVLVLLFAVAVPAQYKRLIQWAESDRPGAPSRAWEAFSAAGFVVAFLAVAVMVLKPF